MQTSKPKLARPLDYQNATYHHRSPNFAHYCPHHQNTSTATLTPHRSCPISQRYSRNSLVEPETDKDIFRYHQFLPSVSYHLQRLTKPNCRILFQLSLLKMRWRRTVSELRKHSRRRHNGRIRLRISHKLMRNGASIDAGWLKIARGSSETEIGRRTGRIK